MFGLFSSTIGTSNETGYDWTQTSLETMGEELLSFHAVAVARPGRILYIEQVKSWSKVIFIFGLTKVHDYVKWLYFISGRWSL